MSGNCVVLQIGHWQINRICCDIIYRNEGRSGVILMKFFDAFLKPVGASLPFVFLSVSKEFYYYFEFICLEFLQVSNKLFLFS